MNLKENFSSDVKAAMRAKRKEERMQRKLEEKKKNVRSRLVRELKYGELTVKRQEKSWEAMLLKITVPKMKEELEYAWHNFERSIDAKDFKISLLMDELRQSEEQYMYNMRNYMDNIDNIIIHCYDQIAGLREDNIKIIHHLYITAQYERSDMLYLVRENEEYLRTMFYMLDVQKKEADKMLRGEYLSKQQVEISRLNEHCQKFTEVCEGKFDNMWKETLSFLKNHISRCANRRRDYYMLRTQDEAMQKLIKSLWGRFKKNFEKIKVIKLKFAEYQYEQSKKIHSLNKERNHFDAMHSTLKKNMMHQLDKDHDNLTTLIVHSNSVIKTLEQIEKKGEKLLKLSAICRKYETPEEKAMPFPIFPEADITLKRVSLPLEINPDTCTYMKELSLFWNRVAQADDLRYKLMEELGYLKEQNSVLKMEIGEYCKCLVCDAGSQIE